MRQGKGRIILAAVLLPVIGILAGCQRNAYEEAAALRQKNGEVIVVMSPESEPEAGFDPAYGWGAGEHVHEPLIQSTLTRTLEDMTIGYDLATAVESGEDGLTWEVKIRTDAVFTDGEPLTAEDVAFTYNMLKESSSVSDVSMLKEAVATDAETVVFIMERPFSIWPYTMATVGIVPAHTYGAEYGSQPIGSGRYVLRQWDRGQQVILEANPDYYGDPPKMKRVTVLFMEEEAAYAAVKTGQADLAYTAAEYAAEPLEGKQLLAYETVDNRGFNLPAVPAQTGEDGIVRGNDFTADVRVRRAINLAIDRELLVAHVLGGYGSPAYSVCDHMPWYNPAGETSYDPAQAAALLEEAGYERKESGLREKDGVTASLELLYPAGDSVRQAMAAEVAEQLRQVGIDSSSRSVGWDEAYTLALSQPLIWGWGAHTPMELYHIYHTVPGTESAEYSPYRNEKTDAYMDAALAASDLESANALWKKAQWDGESGIIQEGDIPWIWLANVQHLYWADTSLQVAPQKLHPHGHGWSIINNVDQWSWET